MRYRRLGRTGLQMSEIGFGAWGIGKEMWQGAEDKESLLALHAAADHGVNFYDTALVYGNGHSERLISQFLKERSETMYVATKVPPKNFRWPAQPGVPIAEVFPAQHILDSTERSLQHLALDSVDLLQFHVWNDEWLAEPDWFAPIEQLKRQGKIRYFGVSLNNHQPENVLKLIDAGLVDTVQVIFNLFDQSPKEKLFPVSLAEDIGIIVRVPFDEGSLTGKIDRHTTFPKDDFRNDYFRGDRRQQVEEHMHHLLECAQLEKSDLPAFALRFCLSWQAVSTVIPGMRTPQHVAANCAVADGNGLPSAFLKKLESQAWQRDFYQ